MVWDCKSSPPECFLNPLISALRTQEIPVQLIWNLHFTAKLHDRNVVCRDLCTMQKIMKTHDASVLLWS